MKPFHLIAVVVLIVATMFYYSGNTVSDNATTDFPQVMTPGLRDKVDRDDPVTGSRIPDAGGASVVPPPTSGLRSDPVADRPESEEARLRETIRAAETAQELENLFFTTQGISSEVLEKVLQDKETFQILLGTLSSISASTVANNRADKLHHVIYNEVSPYIYAEDYACAGIICALQFTSPEADTSKFRVFQQFQNNHFFTGTLSNANGDTDYEMLFFAKDRSDEFSSTP
ncbi:hypothetical protein CA267_007770 [Alteromonas pelagimontana]|uniref:Uncharacterized protein n=1 Tax=Alteromonas pelagimontana TaxID=1858656 RepID=A0A6M4MDM3_9ALTE|nr:hypothetical protein [Alteromonas pelagimontana]QJR80685.1 hypothetical protein CA267_007770 [Alteromonas pelagimontana]